MMQPDALRTGEPLLWSPGRGEDVWEMLCAAAAGDVGAMRRLVEADPVLVRAEYEGRTALSFAVRENHPEAVAFLLARGADPVGSGTPDTLLQIARDRGLDDVRALLERALNPGGGAPEAEAAAAAIRGRDLPELRRLLQVWPALLHAPDERSNRPIHWAVLTRQWDVVDELLARGADVEAQRSDGARPIQLAWGDYHFRAWMKDLPASFEATVAFLRSRGARCDLCTAAYIGDLAQARALLEQDSSLANRASDYVSYYPCSGTPLRNAAAAGHREMVELLLEHGADPNLPEPGIAPRGHALYAAVAHRRIEIAKLLLEHGAHPNVEVDSSADTLSRAIMNGDQPMIDLLCSHGAARPVHLLGHFNDLRTAAAVFAAAPALADDPGALGSAAGHEGFVRLMLRYQPELPRRVAVAGGTREITRLLFRHGMDPSRPDWLHITPLHRFAERGDVENAALFIEHGADLNALDEEFRSSPLGYAAKYGRRRMVLYLLRRGARPALPDAPEWARPLAWARRRGHREIARLLETFEATGDLPPEPSLGEYEALARDLAAACDGADGGAAGRVAAYFDWDPRTWNTGRSVLEDVRHRVQGRLARLRGPGDVSSPLQDHEARGMIASWDGYAGWAQLAAARRP